MVKSAAERMREYRKRLKEDGGKYEDYLMKAKQRKMRNYKPVNQLTRTEKVKRRERNREYVKKHRDKKKAEVESNVPVAPTMSETSGYDSNAHSSTGPMIVNLPFPTRRNGPRKRISRALAVKHREYKDLKVKFDMLQKKYKSNLRSVQRLKKKRTEQTLHVAPVSDENSTVYSSETDSQERQVDMAQTDPNTPRSKTKKMIKAAGLSRKQSSKIRKQLLLAHVVETQIEKCRRGLKTTELGALRGLIGGKIIAKYRLAKSLNKSTGIGRNRLSNTSGLSTSINRFQREREVKRYRSCVLEFLERDDNSRCNPGKQDKLKVNGETRQTRILTDYLKNLHMKFLAENHTVKLSLASFCRIRPANIKLTRFISRSCCLCTRHQNFALCTQALRKNGIDVPLNPERFIEDNANIDRMTTDTPAEIVFGQWKRVTVDDKGKKKMIMKVVTHTMTKEDFLKHMETQVTDFREHVYRVRRQYKESQKIKENLPNNEVIIHMDFAENYSCKSVQEIQSAYWNQSAVTLHPVVLYYKDDTNTLKHHSIVIVSDEMGHNSNTVLTFIDKIIPEIKELIPNVQKVHYLTDSPTSQYRNKTIFRIVANHEDIYGCKAVWNYFEAGHGKGPCDGLGGTTKRMADDAVKSGKVTIQDGEEFFQWTQSAHCTMKAIHFIYIPSSACQQKSCDVNNIDVKPIKGTLKVHAVIGKGNNEILTSVVSCYCTDCIVDEECTLNDWNRHTLNVSFRNTQTTDENQPCSTTEIPEPQQASAKESSSGPESEITDISFGKFVAAMYDGKVYIGKVLQYDSDDDDVEITFMENVRRLLQWPVHEDKIWLNRSDIICNVSEPIPTGNSKRMYKLIDSDFENIQRNK